MPLLTENCPQCQPLQGERVVFLKPLSTKRKRNGPPSDNWGLSTCTSKHNRHHALWCERWHPLNPPCPNPFCSPQWLCGADISKSGSKWPLIGLSKLNITYPMVLKRNVFCNILQGVIRSQYDPGSEFPWSPTHRKLLLLTIILQTFKLTEMMSNTQPTCCPLADIMELKRMMEKLGQAKTHLELKKMIAEVDKTNSGTRW